PAGARRRRAADRGPARTPERGGAHRDGRGHPARRAPRWRHRGRGAVRAAGRGPDDRDGHQPAELPRGPGGRPRGRGRVHPAQPRHGPALRAHRPATRGDGVVTSITAPAPTSATPRPGLWSRVRERVGGGEVLAGGVLLGILVLLAATAPWIAPHDPEAIVSSRVLAGPDHTDPFGSDQLGRDVFSRVLFAFRASLSVAIGSVVLAALIGVPIGLIAGFKG